MQAFLIEISTFLAFYYKPFGRKTQYFQGLFAKKLLLSSHYLCDWCSERECYKLEILSNYSTVKAWGTSGKNISKTSKQTKWKLTDSLKEKIVELAQKDAQDSVYMGDTFINLRKEEVSKVAPNRTALIGKFTQAMNSADASARRDIEEADKKWLCILFGIPYKAEAQGTGYGSAVHVYNELGEEVLTYTGGVGWQEKETKAETEVNSALKWTYYEAYSEARKDLKRDENIAGSIEDVTSQATFDAKA